MLIRQSFNAFFFLGLLDTCEHCFSMFYILDKHSQLQHGFLLATKLELLLLLMVCPLEVDALEDRKAVFQEWQYVPHLQVLISNTHGFLHLNRFLLSLRLLVTLSLEVLVIFFRYTSDRCGCFALKVRRGIFNYSKFHFV